jgi:hypothetical protein
MGDFFGGGGSTTTTETEQDTRLSEELRASSLTGLEGAENLYNLGTEGIYQGTQLAAENPLIAAGQQMLLNQYSDGPLAGLINTGQQQLQNYLTAGDLNNNPVFQMQMKDILNQASTSLERGSIPLFQKASAVGQYGGSEGQEGLGLLAGEIDRNTQSALVESALGQQKLGLDAQRLLPMALQLGEREGMLMSDIGNQRTIRSQQELMDQINMFNAPRDAIRTNLSDFYSFLGSSPLLGESTMTGTETQTTENASDPFGALLGAGLAIAGMPVTGGGSLGGNFLNKMMSGASSSLPVINPAGGNYSPVTPFSLT